MALQECRQYSTILCNIVTISTPLFLFSFLPLTISPFTHFFHLHARLHARSADLPAGAKLKLPLWLTAQLHSKNFVDIEFPKVYVYDTKPYPTGI